MDEFIPRVTEAQRQQHIRDCASQYADFNKSDPFTYNRAMSHMRSNVGVEYHRVIKDNVMIDAFPLYNQFCYGAEKMTASHDGLVVTTYKNVRVP